MPMPKSPTGCPMDGLLRLLTGPWTTYILWILRTQGPQRFGALKRHVAGVSAKMLTERLRLLEGAGVVARDYTPTIPPQVTYSLTARGDELSRVFVELDAIARRWADEDAKAGRPKVGAKRAA